MNLQGIDILVLLGGELLVSSVVEHPKVPGLILAQFYAGFMNQDESCSHFHACYS